MRASENVFDIANTIKAFCNEHNLKWSSTCKIKETSDPDIAGDVKYWITVYRSPNRFIIEFQIDSNKFNAVLVKNKKPYCYSPIDQDWREIERKDFIKAKTACAYILDNWRKKIVEE